VICNQSDSSIYEELPDDLLGGFYYEILNNIKKGILSDAMYYEIDLIKIAADKRGLSIQELHRLGVRLSKEYTQD